VIELSFPADLYSDAALSEAIVAYAGVAECVVERSGDRAVVRVTSTSDADEQLVADELGNYVLGLTIERRGG
jgi:hypothetical protein